MSYFLHMIPTHTRCSLKKKWGLENEVTPTRKKGREGVENSEFVASSFRADRREKPPRACIVMNQEFKYEKIVTYREFIIMMKYFKHSFPAARKIA